MHLKPDATPKFCRGKTVPFALKKPVEVALDSLVEQGIISPVKFSSWAAPIVPVMKQDGTVRLCGDYKVSINHALQVDSYPIPRVEHLFASMSGGKYFSKLDLSQAYLQIPLDDSSKELVTINTHKGLFRYNRLPFGISSAPAIFQRCMENLLQGINGVCVYFDDILVTGSSSEDHLQNLDKVLTKIDEAGLRLKRSKCSFMMSKIEYLGHVIDEHGIHPTEDKVKAIQEAPRPKNVSELRSFIGILNYYGKFLSNLSSKLAPLYKLLQNHSRWKWTDNQEQAFQAAKQALHADTLLVHYNEDLPLVLACDASPQGIGAVLSHIMPDGAEKSIAYASRTLTKAEKNYSQLEKEGLAVVFGVKKYHAYLWGRQFLIESDHKPLSSLFGELKEIPPLASARIQRWALTLSAYRYSIRYKAGKTLCNADALSRLPRPVTTMYDKSPGDLVQLVHHLEATTVSANEIKVWTDRDPILSQVKKFLLQGSPELQHLSDEFKPYQCRRDELSLLDGCVLWGTRVVVPPQGRQSVLRELHETHPGVSKMKSLARSYTWWPNMNKEIEEVVKSCQSCQANQHSPAPAQLHLWEWPDQPWNRLHIDFAGPVKGSMLLVVVDSYSKWLEVHTMPSITSSQTIEKLRSIFATHGLPKTIVSDNGPSLVSSEFKKFLQLNRIRHITSAPYHPSTNGLAERAVQTVKQGIKQMEGDSLEEKLSRFLHKYRITPHSTTGISPSELLMGKRLRSRLDLIYPDVSNQVEGKQWKQKCYHDKKQATRTFINGDLVYSEDFSSAPEK